EPVPIPPSVSYSIAAGTAAGHLGSLGYTLLLLRFVTGRNWRRIVAFRRPDAVHVVLTLLLLPGLMIVHSGIHTLLHLIFETGGAVESEGLKSVLGPWPIWLAILLIGVGPGVIEEIFSRGFLGRGL